MREAIIKLVGVTGAVITLVVLAVVFMRQSGMKQGFSSPHHPWFDRTEWRIEAPSSAALCASQPLLRPGAITWLPVRKTPDAWRVACDRKTNGPTLADVLNRADGGDWLIDVEAGEGADLDNFVDIVEHSGPAKQIAIHAASQRAARYLRKKAPQWVFAADSASLLRLHLFASLFLEPTLDIWPDFVIASDTAAARLSPREVTELRRRRKRIVWDARSGTDAPFAPDGTVTSQVTN